MLVHGKIAVCHIADYMTDIVNIRMQLRYGAVECLRQGGNLIRNRLLIKSQGQIALRHFRHLFTDGINGGKPLGNRIFTEPVA